MAILFWGLTFVAGKVILAEASPLTVVVLRVSIGLVILGLGLFARRIPMRLPNRDLALACLLGFVGVFAQQWLVLSGLDRTSAINSGWLMILSPLFTTVLAKLVLHEEFSSLKITGIVLAFIGAILVISKGRPMIVFQNLSISTTGDLLIVGGSLTWAVYSVAGKGILARHPAIIVTIYAMASGWLLFIPLALHNPVWQELAHLSPRAWGAALFLGICCTSLGYLFWYSALEEMEASTVASHQYLQPVVTLLGAWAVLGERITWPVIAGGPLILAGVYMATRETG
jgi:drug/metabolite transporter (DMT)-like permease